MSLRRSVARGLGPQLGDDPHRGNVSNGAASPYVGQDVSTREVDVAAPDGVTPKATVYSGRPNGPGILLLPMCDTVGGAAWAPLAAELWRNGYT